MAFKPSNPDDPPRDRPFEDFRFPKSSNARAIVFDVIGQLQRYEELHGLRRRKRKADDQRTFEATVSAIVSDLCDRWLTEPEGWIAVSLSKDTLCRADRYKSIAKNKTLPDIIKRLASPELAIVEMNKGFQGFFTNGRQTTIKAGGNLIQSIEDRGLHPSEFTVKKDKEVIILKTGKTDVFTKGKPVGYQDSETTIRYRQEMHRINEWLSRADISLDPNVAFLYGTDGSSRYLRRIFNNNSFECGGRLYGGFWINMMPADRFRGILIKGAPVVMVDYSQMSARLLYAMAGVKPPEDDLYSIPLFMQYRKGIKAVFNAMLNVEKRFERFPSGTRKLFHRSEKIRRVVEHIEAYHIPINHFFFTNVGLKTMFLDSQIMVAVMLKLIEKGIVGLPVHDGILVGESDKETVIITMLNVFKAHTGQEGKVSIDSGQGETH